MQIFKSINFIPVYYYRQRSDGKKPPFGSLAVAYFCRNHGGMSVRHRGFVDDIVLLHSVKVAPSLSPPISRIASTSYPNVFTHSQHGRQSSALLSELK